MGRSLYRERGLKSPATDFMSERQCRSLYRERGLKLYHIPNEGKRRSLPLPGAWIEIFSSARLRSVPQSLPLPGAWIEIP